jgi:hypothetical protein
MLDKIREQRDRWQQRAEQLAAFSITDQRKEVFLVFWGCSECTVSQRFFLYQVGNRTHTPPDASIAQLGWAGGSAVFYEDCHSLPALRWF